MDEGRPPDPEPEPDLGGGPDLGGPDEPEALPVETEEIGLEPRGPRRSVIAIALVLVAALVVFAIVGGRIITNPATAPTPRPDARLATVGADGRLSTMDARGGSVVEYPGSGVRIGFPAWSPDGTRVAATATDSDSIAVDLFDVAAGKTAPTVLYDSPESPPFYLYWSPDGRRVAFLTTEDDGIALRIVPADGSAEAKVIRKGAPFYWDWFGSDHLVAHIGSSGKGSFLGEVDLDGTSTEPERLEPGLFRSPAVSHDGTFRAFVTTTEGAANAVTVESVDRSSRQSANVFGVAAVAFDPTGRTLAFVAATKPLANDPGFPLGPLRALDPSTGDTRTLLDGDVVAFFWAPDGKTIAALTLNAPSDETVGRAGRQVAAAGGPVALSAPAGAAARVQPAATGVPLTLSFVDFASGRVRESRAAQVTSTFVNLVLPYYDQYALSHRVWAPDSSAIALPLVDDGIDRLFVVPADGSPPRPLDGAEIGFWSP
jgi:WD40-like Beta Propeller Repeat